MPRTWLRPSKIKTREQYQYAPREKMDDEGILWLDSALRIRLHIGLSDTLSRLERNMESECLEEQLSGSGFYYLNFIGR